MRFSVGAVNVAHRQLRLFRQRHAHRSGPSTSWRAARCRPAFPPVEIDGEHYWDGGLVSNTPLQWVLEASRARIRWSSRSICGARAARCRATSARSRRARRKSNIPAARAPTPTSSSRSRAAQRPGRPAAKLPDRAARDDRKLTLLQPEADHKVYNIVQLIYRSKQLRGQVEGLRVLPHTMEEHWQAGYNDTVRTLAPSRGAGAAGQPTASSPSMSPQHGRE